MEKLNLNFSGGENVIKSICWILSVLSWLLFIVTGWISLRWLDYDGTAIIWNIKKMYNSGKNYYPVQMQVSLIYIVFILTMIIALAGFILYMMKSTCKKDDAVFGGMIGPWSKFHFFPLLCVSALFIIGECYDNFMQRDNIFQYYYNFQSYYEKFVQKNKDMYISGLIFTIIGLGSLIFIYIMTDLNTDWYILLTLKKGTYSCLITLMWYHFCYLIYPIRTIDNLNDNWNWMKGCGISFSIIFGIGALVFAFIFKDLVIAGMTTIIYVGLTAYYLTLDKKTREEANKNGDGSVDIVMMVLSLALIVFLIIKHKDDCLKS